MRKKHHCVSGLDEVTLEHTEYFNQKDLHPYKKRSSDRGMRSEASIRDYSDASIYRQRLPKMTADIIGWKKHF